MQQGSQNDIISVVSNYMVFHLYVSIDYAYRRNYML